MNSLLDGRDRTPTGSLFPDDRTWSGERRWSWEGVSKTVSWSS